MRLPDDWTPPCAARHAGAFTSAQAEEAGATRDQVRYRRRTGVWRVVAGRGLAHRDASLSHRTAIHAAALTVPDGVVSHRAAAALYGLPVSPTASVDLVVARRTRCRPGIRTYELPLAESEIVTIEGLRTTTLTRTVTDCLGILTGDEWSGLLAWVVTRGLVSGADAGRAVSTHLGAPGNAGRRRALPLLTARAASAAELRLHAVLRRFGISGWEANAPVRVSGRILAVADVLFAARRVVVEVDGQRFHGPDRAAADVRRDALLTAAGYRVVRLTAAEIAHDPWATAERVRCALEPPA